MPLPIFVVTITIINKCTFIDLKKKVQIEEILLKS